MAGGSLRALQEILGHKTLEMTMEISFLCRARLGEILKLQHRHLTEEGLLLERSKKSKTQIILYGPRLNATFEAAKELPGVCWQRYVLHNKGQQIKEYTFKSAWQRLMVKAKKDGFIKDRFTFHDLKAKGVSDFDGDKKLASGHRTERMVDVYDRKPGTVEPTR